jgi:hypothetical protein
LGLLRDWYRIARPAVWLFPGRDPLLPLTTRQFNRVGRAAVSSMPAEPKPATQTTTQPARTTVSASTIANRRGFMTAASTLHQGCDAAEP